ncbi:MAG: hypothetical protein V4456_11710 [Bacteroidota bacterium]
MNEFFSPAVIAATTSLLISLITLYQFFKNKRLQEDLYLKGSNRALTIKLYELRLEHYPKALEIIEEIYRKKGGTIEIGIVRNVLNELIDWKKGIINLIISNEAHESYYKLRDTLMKKSAFEDKFSNEQVQHIIISTKEFRRQLRRDVGFLFREEKARRNSEIS